MTCIGLRDKNGQTHSYECKGEKWEMTATFSARTLFSPLTEYQIKAKQMPRGLLNGKTHTQIQTH